MTIHIIQSAGSALRPVAWFLRPQTFAAMVAPQWCPDERLTHAGLSFARSSRFGPPAFGHGGQVFGGWNTNLTVVPDRNLAIVIHLNLMLYDAEHVFGRIIRAALNLSPPVAPDLPIDPDILASAPGVYEATPGRLTNFRITSGIGRLQISADGSGLVLHSRRGAWKAGVRLRPADPADPAFFMIDKPSEEPAYLLLTRDRGGRVNGLRCDDLVHMVRTDAVEPWA